MVRFLSLKHLISPSPATRLAYHIGGATPLMVAILVGRFGVAASLLKAGARIDLKRLGLSKDPYFNIAHIYSI